MSLEPAEKAKTRILLVDDEPDICELLREMLSPHGWPCESCFNAADALSTLGRQRFDLVISDIRMPGMSGLELLTEIHQRYPQVAVVMATGEADVRMGVDAMKRGASDYLVKPLQPDAVIASVLRAVKIKRLERELEEHRQHLEKMVDQRTHQLRTALHRVEITYDETLKALGDALDLRDNETAGHSQRVTRYCLEMAKALHCAEDQRNEIARGAYLHDIGKIGIPDGILRKPGGLSDEERMVMETHVRIGYNLVSGISFLAPAAHIVLTHHERFDGTGYPQGLVGHEIPLSARIFAVADTLDAMTSDRPYRHAVPFAQAFEEIEHQSGRQFDPEVVSAFLSVPPERWQEIRGETESARNEFLHASAASMAVLRS